MSSHSVGLGLRPLLAGASVRPGRFSITATNAAEPDLLAAAQRQKLVGIGFVTAQAERKPKSRCGSSGRAGSAPELSTWAMMLAGFASLGVAGYRRRGKRPLLA